jgi:hypothetical protein
MSQTGNFTKPLFVFRTSGLFRTSDFGFRASDFVAGRAESAR